ncbi:glycosyltransferase family 22 protein [Sphaerobolus stellatus SS14]|uniref:Mannosyltransferase n=1 Tax=Sphaerobolus stellatus (strain SS14) TaxID=990650 RepID=A0A0C9V259_SPHS4|nr:glycosyltransferase family 22 protein [Sphaerobolus stellatus SS14]
MVPSSIIAASVALRVGIALLTSTFFQPDEYFQSLEPAHRMVFGYGHLTWEWKTSPPIRSVFFPALFTPVYWFLKVSDLDDTILLILAPKVLQGLFASITDISVYRLTQKILGDRFAFMAVLLSFTSIFHLQALSRTLSNSVETSLTTLALSYWPLTTLGNKPFIIPLVAAAAACMIRPTNAIIWAFVFLETSWRLRNNLSNLLRLWMQAIVIAICSCASLFLLDSWYFGKHTFTPLNFLIANLSPISSFYGRSPWHYYLIQGIPILCDLSTPWFLKGSWNILQNGTPPLRRLLGIICFTVFVYSLAAHKEWRFIHPLLPMMHVITAKSLVDIATFEKISSLWDIPVRWRRLGMIGGAILVPFLLFIQSHAQISVMYQLRSTYHLRSVGFLMPCHSTPWQSYLHRPHLDQHSLWAIGCEPPLHGENLSTYKDQSDVFYDSPLRYLKTRFPKSVDPQFLPSPFPSSIPGATDTGRDWEHTWPSHLILFGALLEIDGVRPLLEDLGYTEDWHGWNGWEQDHRRRGGVRIWRWQPGQIIINMKSFKDMVA